MAIIRPEQPGDEPEIAAVQIAAFDTAAEATLVDRLRGTPDWVPELSLVVQDGDSIIAHLLLSDVTAGEAVALILGPVAVLPDHQRQGIGSVLVTTALARAAELDFGCVLVVGSPGFFPRFGFRSARGRGFETEMPILDEAFLVAELGVGGCAGGGTVRFPEAWDDR